MSDGTNRNDLLDQKQGEDSGIETVTDRMNSEENYLEAIRRDMRLGDMKAGLEAYYSDFILEEGAAGPEQREFLDGMQSVARQYLTTLEEHEKHGKKKPVNAQLCIKTSPDEMETWLFVFPPEKGGKEISAELILNVLNRCGVIYGIDEDLVKQVEISKLYLRLAVIARGSLPVDGTPGKVTDHFPRISIPKSEQLDELPNDFGDVDWIHHVEQGDVICDLLFPVPSRDGSTVTGKLLKGRKIGLIDIPKGTNTDLNEERTALVAEITGTLIYEHGKFAVKNVRNLLSDVDSSVGNIDTIGNLEIRGDVISGFSVQTTGDITIRGMVGNSVIKAGGRITIGMGVRGGGDAVLEAGGDIKCGYMENCMVTARGSIESKTIINCEVMAYGSIKSQKVVGGSVSALCRIDVKTVGNRHRRPTSICLGSTKEIRQEKIELDTRIGDLRYSMGQLDKEIRMLKRKTDKSVDDELELGELMGEYAEQKSERTEAENALRSINAGLNSFRESGLMASVLYPPVTVTMVDDSIIIDQEMNMCRVWAVDGEIKIS